MARERERAEPARREEVVRSEGERAPEHACGARVVAGVARLSRALLVGEAEQGVRVGVVGSRPERVLQLGDERRGVCGPELILERVRLRDDCRGRRRSGGVAQRAAEEESRGSQRHGCGCEDEVGETWSGHGLLPPGKGPPLGRALRAGRVATASAAPWCCRSR